MNLKFVNHDEINNSKYKDYFKNLNDLNEKQEKIIQNNNAVIQILNHDFQKNIKQLIEELLTYFNNEQFSSIRIILDKPKLSFGGKSITGGIGEKNDLYAYLDEQIISQIGNSGILYISDTTKIHTIKFAEGNQFPKTILSISIGVKNNKLGNIWFTCEDQKIFTKFQADSLIKLTEACAYLIQNCIEWNEINFDNNYFNDALNLMESSLIIVSRLDVIFSNLMAKKIIKLSLDDNNEKKMFIKKIWELNNDTNNHLTINGINYQIKFIDSIEGTHEIYRIILLVDETILQKQINYTPLVLNSLSQSLRSSLNIVLGSVKMVPFMGVTNKQQNDYLITIENKTQDLLAITEELLDLERLIKSNGLRIQKKDIKPVIDKSTELVSHLIKQKRISLITNQLDSDNLIDIDEALFTQALVNVLEYAIAQARVDTEIIFKVSASREKCIISISDSSNGLSKVDIEKLNSFENPHEIPSGLLLVRRIIDFHHGIFAIQSELGKGNIYTIEIPQQISISL